MSSTNPPNSQSIDVDCGTTPPKRFDDAQDYCIFPARETGLALRILDSSKAPSASGFKDTFYSRTKSLWFEIQSIQQKLKSLMAAQPENTGQGKHVLLGELQNVLITGVSLHMPELKDAVLVIGQLMDLNRYPQDPLGFRGTGETAIPVWDKSPSETGKIRFWIFDRALIDENKKVLHLTEKGHPGLTQMAIFKGDKLDKQTLRRCDFTHSLGRLINLYTPWAEAYFPKFQIYHPDLDMQWVEQSSDAKAEVSDYEPNHRGAFCEQGITSCEMLVLPCALELLCVMLKNAAEIQLTDSQNKPQEPAFLFKDDVLLDLHESIKRLAHFFDCHTQSPFGRWDHAPYLTAPKWAKAEHLKPADIAEAVADNLAYGIDTCGEDIGSPEFSPVKKGFELNKTQACGLFEELIDCLVEQIRLEGNGKTEEDQAKNAQLQALENRLIQDKVAGPQIWVRLRVGIEKALLRQKKLKFSLSSKTPIPIVATQVAVGSRRLFTSKGLTLELFRNELQTYAYKWMTPFVQAPVSTCVKIQIEESNKASADGVQYGQFQATEFHATELKIKRLSILANRFDSDSPQGQTSFVESGFYTPQAVYGSPEEAREALELILEMGGGIGGNGEQQLSLLTLSSAKSKDWLAFLDTASFHAKAALFDERLRAQ